MSEHLTPIPPGHRILHIGLPKSGTTALQSAARARRSELIERGALYPGTLLNHNEALSPMMRRAPGTGTWPTPPTMRDWEALLAEVESHPQARTLISYELLCGVPEEAANDIVEAFGAERTHVVMTVRGLAAMLPSIWQQDVKTGVRLQFPDWCEAAIGEPNPDLPPVSYRARHELPGVLRRWTQRIDPARFSVVILDRATPDLMTNAFEDMLGLERGFLSEQEGDGASENRSLTAAEVELVRQIHVKAAPRGIGRLERSQMITNGAARGIQRLPADGADAGPVKVPAWAVATAQDKAAEAIALFDELGVTVVGDPAALAAGARTVPEGEEFPVPARISAEAVARGLAEVADRAARTATRAERKSEPTLHEGLAERARAEAGARLMLVPPGVAGDVLAAVGADCEPRVTAIRVGDAVADGLRGGGRGVMLALPDGGAVLQGLWERDVLEGSQQSFAEWLAEQDDGGVTRALGGLLGELRALAARRGLRHVTVWRPSSLAAGADLGRECASGAGVGVAETEVRPRLLTVVEADLVRRATGLVEPKTRASVAFAPTVGMGVLEGAWRIAPEAVPTQAAVGADEAAILARVRREFEGELEALGLAGEGMGAESGSELGLQSDASGATIETEAAAVLLTGVISRGLGRGEYFSEATRSDWRPALPPAGSSGRGGAAGSGSLVGRARRMAGRVVRGVRRRLRRAR